MSTYSPLLIILENTRHTLNTEESYAKIKCQKSKGNLKIKILSLYSNLVAERALRCFPHTTSGS